LLTFTHRPGMSRAAAADTARQQRHASDGPM